MDAPSEHNDPLIITICGDSGMGKTSLAATFPNPIYISTVGEGLPRDIASQPKKFKPCETADDVFSQIEWLLNNEHDFKTLIIDSVTGLERLLIDKIEKETNKLINNAYGGFGAGFAAVASEHASLHCICGKLSREKGMHIIFIAHADIDQIDPPDGDPYGKYTLRIGKKGRAPYVDGVDCVAFVKLQTFVKGDDGKKKAVSTDQRVLVCYATAANVSKNRLGITQDILLNAGENPFQEYM